MAGEVQPLSNRIPIVNDDGTPTVYFIQQLQQRGILLTDAEKAIVANTAAIDRIDATEVIAGTGLDGGGPIGAGNITLDADTQAILDEITSTQGSVLYRGAGAWGALAPGTSGQFLKTNGAGADPEWATGGGGGGGGWTLHAEWDFAVDGAVAEIDFIDLPAGATVMIVADQVTKSVSGQPRVNLSVDNGATFYTTTGDYKFITTSGSNGDSASVADLHTGASTAARGGYATFTTTSPTIVNYWAADQFRYLVASALPANAARITPSNGGDFTGGVIYCFVKP